MIKRISLLLTAALLVATMAMAGLAAPAFAVNNCKGDALTTDTNSNPGHFEAQCTKGSTDYTVEKRGQGDGQGNSSLESCKNNRPCNDQRPAP